MKYKLVDNSLNDIFNPIKTVLLNRGVSQYNEYLNLTDEYICDWRDLDNIHEAVECFNEHLVAKNRMSILIDNDPDGVSSAAMMYRYIKLMYPDYPVDFIVHEYNKTHGLTGDFDIPDGTKLLIIPDAATNDAVECNKLIDSGMSIIILDHHQKNDSDIKNNAIIVNNQLSNNYACKDFCGAGVVYEFLRALDDYYWNDYADEFLDLVSFANISDVMSLADLSTRYYVDKGIDNIKSEALLAMIKAQDFSMKGIVNPHTIAWYVTPVFNAMIRIGSFEDRQLLFRAFIGDDEKSEYKKRNGDIIIENIYERCARVAKSYKGKQDRAKEKSFKLIMNKVDANSDDKVAIIDATEDLDKSLTGLVAIKISETIHKPVLLVKEFNGELAGSGRAFNNCPVEDFRGLTDNCPYITYSQGHNSAFGTSMPVENLKSATQWLNEQLKDVSMDKVYTTDFIIDIDSLNMQFIQDIDTYQYLWGHGIEEPLVAIENITVYRDEIKMQGKNLDSVAFKNNDIKFVAFKMDEDNPLLEFASAWDGEPDDAITINAICNVGVNNYNGACEFQCIINECEVV